MSCRRRSILAAIFTMFCRGQTPVFYLGICFYQTAMYDAARLLLDLIVFLKFKERLVVSEQLDDVIMICNATATDVRSVIILCSFDI